MAPRLVAIVGIVAAATAWAFAGSASSTVPPTATSVPAEPVDRVPKPVLQARAEPTEVRFTAGGDIGADEITDETLEALATRRGEFFLALGDLRYDHLETEREWCDYVKGHLGETFPVQLVVGNHEDDDRRDGFIGDFAACLPDRMQSTGTYGAEYFFDLGTLLRVVMIGADNDVDGVKYDYQPGSERFAWLTDVLESANEDGIRWIVAGMHKPCITAGVKRCEVDPAMIDLLIEQGVDLVLTGHEHNYQRSKQLECVVVGEFREGCVVDDGADGSHRAGQGTIFVIIGNTGGRGMHAIDPDDPELGYFAATLGSRDELAGRGFLAVEVTARSMVVEFVGTTTDFSDRFELTTRPEECICPSRWPDPELAEKFLPGP